MSQSVVKSNSWQKRLQWVVCLFFPICVVIIMSEGLLGSMRQLWAYSYSETVGTITHSQLKKDDENSRLIDVEYSFEVLGRKYQGNQYCYGAIRTNTSVWDNIQQNLPVGRHVAVYYQSNKPEEAVLVQGLLGFHYGLLWFSSMFILAGPFIWHWMMDHQQAFDPSDNRLIARSAHGWEYRPKGRDWWRYFIAGMLAISLQEALFSSPTICRLQLLVLLWLCYFFYPA